MFGLVCQNWSGREVYTSFYRTADEAIRIATNSAGVIRVEKAHAGEPPIWVREEKTA